MFGSPPVAGSGQSLYDFVATHRTAFRTLSLAVAFVPCPWSGRMKRQQTAERRQVTVLHVDIVNSTALVDELDPEEIMGLMQSYVDSCKTIIDGCHGSLAGYTGDGFEAYFGYPVAREDAASNAVNAAIRIGEML